MNILFVKLMIYVIICGYNSEAIINGTRANKRYMIYLLSPAQEHQPAPNDWLCGGAIITSKHIISSAACIVYNWKLAWVIAGYNKYVDYKNMGIDQCTKRYKKKLQKVYVEVGYPSYYHNKGKYVEQWRIHNIAIGEVETPYNFSDVSYLKYCTYIPNAIKMSFRGESYAPGVDAVVFGWGSSKYYRPDLYSVNLNQPYLMGTSVLLMDRKACKEIEKGMKFTGIDYIRRHVLCTLGHGNVDVNGNFVGYQAGRDNLNKSDVPDYKRIDKLFKDPKYMNNSKPNGFCQNDQGGPLVTWMGGVEYLIGVASAFIVNEDMRCVGPFIYISVGLTAKYVNCSLSASSRRSNLGVCDLSTVLERDDDPISQTHEPYTTEKKQDD